MFYKVIGQYTVLMDYKIVVAHPDDEIIFFNSKLAGAESVIICFGQSDDPAVTAGRAVVKDNFPLDRAKFLWITEANVFDAVSFPRQSVIPEGVTVARNQDRYHKNFATITAMLETELAQDDVVFTHNPWGEYGHEEHVQVFQAVLALQKRMNLKIYVSNYVSDKSMPLMQQRHHLLSAQTIVGNPCQKLGQQYLDLYADNNSWTWDADYIWPATEMFFAINPRPDTDQPQSDAVTASPPLNILSRRFIEVERSKFRKLLSRFSPRRLLKPS